MENILAPQIPFKDFQPSVNNWLYELLFKDLHQQNEPVFLIWVSHCFHFRAVYGCIIAHDGILISLQEHCSANN